MAVTTDFLKGILEEFQNASSNLLPWDKSQLPSALAAKQLDAGGSGGSGGAAAGDIGDAVNRPKSTFTGTVTTSNTGSLFVQLPSNLASLVVLYNRSGTEISWRYGESGQELRIANGIGEAIPVVGNSNTIQIRRTDQSNTTVTLNFRGVLM